MSEKNVTAKQMDFTGDDGVSRVCIGASLPNPVVDGVVMKREVSVSGIQLNDSKGNEIGGFGVIEGHRIGVMALDYTHHEAVGMYASDEEDGASAGIFVNQKVGFKDGRNTAPYKRIEISVAKGVPKLVFKGKNGKPRMVIGLDEDDNPVIEVIDSKGVSKSVIPAD